LKNLWRQAKVLKRMMASKDGGAMKEDG